MIRSNTSKVLTASLNPELSADASAQPLDWIKHETPVPLGPIHTGSIYIKPIEERKSICNKCFSYFYYFFCCTFLKVYIYK